MQVFAFLLDLTAACAPSRDAWEALAALHIARWLCSYKSARDDSFADARSNWRAFFQLYARPLNNAADVFAFYTSCITSKDMHQANTYIPLTLALGAVAQCSGHCSKLAAWQIEAALLPLGSRGKYGQQPEPMRLEAQHAALQLLASLPQPAGGDCAVAAQPPSGFCCCRQALGRALAGLSACAIPPASLDTHKALPSGKVGNQECSMSSMTVLTYQATQAALRRFVTVWPINSTGITSVRCPGKCKRFAFARKDGHLVGINGLGRHGETTGHKLSSVQLLLTTDSQAAQAAACVYASRWVQEEPVLHSSEIASEPHLASMLVLTEPHSLVGKKVSRWKVADKEKLAKLGYGEQEGQGATIWMFALNTCTASRTS